MTAFLMPALGADMETAKVAQWLVPSGARVKSGDVVLVVETLKGAIEVEIFLDGVMQELAPEGTELPVGGVLAQVVETAPAQAAARPTPQHSPPAMPMPVPVPVSVPAEPMPSQMREPPAKHTPKSARPKASPAARQLARALNIPLASLSGSGGQGAIVRADVERAAAALVQAPAPIPLAATTAPHTNAPGFDPAQMRKAIAMAMARSKREIPHYYLSTTIDFETASAWLAMFNGTQAPPDRLLPAALLIKAGALALREVPQLNGFFDNDRLRPASGIHPGWAIALRGGGLVAPAIHDADAKSLPELMSALRDLVQRARSGGLRSSELADPSTTFTSLGDRGADGVLGVIYPPQVAIIGFGRLVQRPWVVGDRVVPRTVLTVSLAADHRASDGHLGGLLLAAIDKALQSPEQL